THELHEQGKYLGASPLHPVSTATSVRVRQGKRQVTDGPFAETREQLGGFFLIDAANLDEAIEIAGRIPGARKGTIEVRPLLSWRGCLRSEPSVSPEHKAQGAPIMRFLVMVKYDENVTPPPQSLLAALAKNRLEAKRAGALVEVGGLFPSASGAR